NSHLTSYSQNIDRDSISLEPVIKNNSCHMTVTKPKLAIGYRKSSHMRHGSYLKEKIGLQLFFAMLLGWTSTINQDWYESGQIDDSFDIEIEVHPDFECVIISLDTTEPIAFSTQLRLLLKNALQSSDLTESHLQNVKRELYGDFLRSLDSIENLAMQFVTYLYDGKTMYLDLPSIVEELDLEDVITIGKDFLDNADTSDFVIFPKSS
ncbi:insulinase family protein, partial [Streptococcus agalactiae]|nr:insulinase family protein [Streptococcus agalactiae]